MRSVDVAFFKNEIEYLNKEVEEVFLNHFDPLVEINLRYSLLSGKEGVGQEANAMVDINRMGELFMHSLDLQDWGYSDKSLDKEYSEELSEKDLNYYVEDAVKTGLIKESEKDRFKEYIKAVELSESMTAILNAFVDIAKNNYISKGNWNTNTTNTGNLLLRKGVHPLYIISFLSNPVLKSFIEYE